MLTIVPSFPAEGSFLGPEPVTVAARKVLELSPSKTIGFVPITNLEFKPKPIIAPEVVSKLDFSEDVEKITTFKKVDLALINELSSDIKDHFETRLQNDFVLFTQVYKTNLIFREYQTQHQVGQATGSEATYVAAHCSTFPNLVCWRLVENATAHMFAYESTSYFNRNTTTMVPTEVNKIDSALEPYIRQMGIAILNQLSPANAGLTPKEGFKGFIIAITTKLQALLKEKGDDPISHKVISDYLRVSQAYHQFLNNGQEHLTHKLCFAYKLQPPVTEELFISVKSQINDPVAKEMHSLKVKYDQVQNDETVLKGKMLDYFGFCFHSEEVQKVVRNYFGTTAASVQEADKKKAHDPKLSISKVAQIGFSEKMLIVFNTCIKVIQSFNDVKGIKPQKLCVLFPRILKEVMTNPVPSVLYATPVIQPTVLTRAAAKSQIGGGVKAAAVKSEVEALVNVTAKKYAKMMYRAESVKKIAANYFSATSAAIQQADLKKAGLLSQKKDKYKTVGFSPLMGQLVEECLGVIRTKKAPKLVPRQLDDIIFAVVSDLKAGF